MHDNEDIQGAGDADRVERGNALKMVIRCMEEGYGKQFTKSQLAVVSAVFERTLGSRKKSSWDHSGRWGRAKGDESCSGSQEGPIPPDPGNPREQRAFRIHMLRLAQCMGREAAIDAEGHGLHPDVLRGSMVKVMIRSYKAGCGPLEPPKQGGRCAPEATELQFRYPHVCKPYIEDIEGGSTE